MCGRLPAPMLDRGTPAGIYPCGLFTNEPLNWGTVPLNWKYRQDQMPQCAA